MLLRLCAFSTLIFFSVPGISAMLSGAIARTPCDIILEKKTLSFIPLRTPWLVGARGGGAIATSRGELYVAASRNNQTLLVELNAGESHTIAQGNVIEASDLFETKSGGVYF